MKQLRYTILGAFFGMLLYKSELISWFRIQEMFRFDSFHMYGTIGGAVAVAALALVVMKRSDAVSITPKKLDKGTVIGGLIFGIGWALTGACPGPLYAHIGAGTSVMVVTIVMAIIGAWVYALVHPKLPH